MKLSFDDVKSLVKESQSHIEEAYFYALAEDEYFNRGFLLATNEFSKLLVNVLSQYEVRTHES